MISDLIVAGRGLRRSPAFTVAAIVTLALGHWRQHDDVLRRERRASAPVAWLSDRSARSDLRRFANARFGSPGSCSFLAPEVYQRLREQLHSFAPLAANQNCRMNLTGPGEPEQLAGPCTTANWFALQRAQALLGRTFLPDEDQHGRNKVVVLDHRYWQRRFGADPKVIGKTLVLDKEPWVVIGVMPPDFRPIGTTASTDLHALRRRGQPAWTAGNRETQAWRFARSRAS